MVNDKTAVLNMILVLKSVNQRWAIARQLLESRRVATARGSSAQSLVA